MRTQSRRDDGTQVTVEAPNGPEPTFRVYESRPTAPDDYGRELAQAELTESERLRFTLDADSLRSARYDADDETASRAYEQSRADD